MGDGRPVAWDAAGKDALAFCTGVCHEGAVRRLRDFDSVARFFSDREIEEIQAAVDARREARAVRSGDPPAAPVQPEPGTHARGTADRRSGV